MGDKDIDIANNDNVIIDHYRSVEDRNDKDDYIENDNNNIRKGY